MKWIFIILVFVRVRSRSANTSEIDSPCIDKNHFFLAPGVLTAGGTNRACISRFHPDGIAKMTLVLHSEDQQTVAASRDLAPGDGGCLDISVPLLPNTKADLVVKVLYPHAKCVWEKRITLRIASGSIVVVHTERARYRPGETLRVRVFSLKVDLTPAPGNVEEIWLEGPPGAWEGTRVAQWTNERSKMGLAQVQHVIDEQAPPGRWTVRAKLVDGSQGSAVFWVGQYEVPPFQLVVRYASRVLRASERLVWTVCVRYPWTEAVEGMLVIRLRGAGSDSSGIRTAVRLRAPRACHRHAAAAKRVGLGGDHPPDVIVADFSFQEEGTRVWQNTTVVSQVVDKPITLDFVTKYRTVISPGLPYKLKVKATRWDDKPASSQTIRVCRYASHGDDQANEKIQSHTDKPTCVRGNSDSGGIARIMFAAEDDSQTGSPFYRFVASLANDSTISTAPLTLAVRRSAIQAALGPVRADSRGTRTFVPLYLSQQNVTTPVTVHFVVITRGGIVYRWGATTQCPIASSSPHIQTAQRNSKCEPSMAQSDAEVGSQHDRKKRRQSHRNRTRTNRKKKSQETNAQTSLKEAASFLRNMNQNDKNNYINKNVDIDSNQTVYDKFNPVLVEVDVYEKTNDVNSIPLEESASDSLLDRHLLRVMLPIKVTQQMCPDSHLIAYFYYKGEFVSASKHFEMDDCFINNVEASFVSRQVLPRKLATMKLSTPGPALCALTALDSAKVSPQHGVREALLRGLRRVIDGRRNVSEYDAAGDCFLSAEVPQLPTNSLERTATWLAAAGVRTVADIAVKIHCDTPASLTDEGTVPRSDFSEAWLWRLVSVPANGTAQITATVPDSITRYEANAVCLSKTGIAISQPAPLQVFREFFIHADSPKRLRNGDSTVIRYRLFNYLYEPLSIQIQIQTSVHLKAPPELVESVCVAPRASAARRAALVAAAPGAAALTISAKAVNDGGCGNGTRRTKLGAISDAVIVKITVEPEGVPVHEHKSMLICGQGSKPSIIFAYGKRKYSRVQWKFPHAGAVPGTGRLTMWLSAETLGPLLSDADDLVLLPRGCGEQNMARLATNLLALSQLDRDSVAALTAKQHVARGFTRQLQYIHASGGFSAFGATDATPSTWLTAFSLRYLRKAHRLLWPRDSVPSAIEKAERWLLNQQMENGCFRNEGQVFHRELRGGLNEEGEIASVALTAYVITSLISGEANLPPRALRNTLSCLRALPPLKYKTPARIYAHSLLANAFMKLKEYKEELVRASEAKYEELRNANIKYDIRTSDESIWLVKEGLKENEGLLEMIELIKMARKEGEFLWWETGSLSTSIEATSYALIALIEAPALLHENSAPALRWLAAHRGASGGFVSTQDTLVALEALSAWRSRQSLPTELMVMTRVVPDKASKGTLSRVDTLGPKALLPLRMDMGSGDEVEVVVEGTGCALLQATRSYNTLSAEAPRHKRISVRLSIHTDGPFDCDTTGNCFCAAVIEACVLWTGLFPDMALMEVSLPGGYGADSSKLYAQLNQPDSLLRRIELNPMGSRATLYLGSRGAAATTPWHGHACFKIHTVGPQARTKPAYVRVLDYYSPSINDTQIYTIPEDCPSRESHVANQNVTSDNIYYKALSHKRDILITNDFTYEDIPEGIPLEDPLYENLKKEDVGTTTKESDPTDTVRDAIMQNYMDNNYNGMSEAVYSETSTHKLMFDSKSDDDTLYFDNSDNPIAPNNDSSHIARISNKYINNPKRRNANAITKPKFIDISFKENFQPASNETSSERTAAANKTTQNHKIEMRDEHKSDLQVDNPTLHNFHVIDSEKDLEMPSGMEGPIPSILLPPDRFIPLPGYPMSQKFRPTRYRWVPEPPPRPFNEGQYENTTYIDRMLYYTRRSGQD